MNDTDNSTDTDNTDNWQEFSIVELRNMLNQKRTQRSFDDIWNFFNAARKDGHAYDMLLDYALGHLDSWPDDTRRVTSMDIQGDIPDFAQMVRHIDGGFLGALQEDVDAIADSPYMTNLKTLNLWDSNLGSDGIVALTKSPYLTNLQYLNLGANKLGQDGVALIAESPTLKNLTALNLWSNQILDITSLVNSPNMQGIKHLRLYSNQIGDQGAIAIANSPYMSNLESLDLNDSRITDEGVIALANSPYMSNLKKLRLDNNLIKQEGARALGESTCLPMLEELDLSFRLYNPMIYQQQPEARQLIANSQHLCEKIKAAYRDKD